MKLTKDMVSVRQAANDSPFKEAWWRKQIWLRRVPFYRVGGRIFVSRRDIAALFRKGRVEPVESGGNLMRRASRRAQKAPAQRSTGKRPSRMPDSVGLEKSAE